MQDSIFTKIIKGQIPCHKIYEDDRTIAFLDIHPVQPGHTLVIPKAQVEFVWDLDDLDYHALMVTTKKVARQLRQVLRLPYVHERIVGTDVPHAHVHLIPFTNSAQIYGHPDESGSSDQAALSALAEKLTFA